MEFSSIFVDEQITSGNINELNSRFEESLDKYFDCNDELILEFVESVGCPCCDTYEGKSFKQRRFTYRRCSQCDMVYVSPRFKEEINTEIHSQDRYKEHFKCKIIPSMEYRKNVIAKNKYNQVMNFFESPGKALDIGCGLCEVLSIFRENGWDCRGLDFNQFAIEYAHKNFEVEVINKDVLEFKTETKFDLIMLWGMLEHTYHPIEILKKAHKMLKKGGLLAMEIPSSDSFLVRYCESTGKEAHRTFEAARHLMLFSNESINEICKKTGFKLEKLISNGLDIATVARMNSVNLPLEHANTIQNFLDESLQGDLYRAFLRK